MRLVAAFKEHQDKGQGAFVFEGGLLLSQVVAHPVGKSAAEGFCGHRARCIQKQNAKGQAAFVLESN
jgi:hypothetical protein